MDRAEIISLAQRKAQALVESGDPACALMTLLGYLGFYGATRPLWARLLPEVERLLDDRSQLSTMVAISFIDAIASQSQAPAFV